MRIVERTVPGELDDAFVALPHEVYTGDPCWIPEEEAVLRRAFSAANPWFARGRAIALCVPGRARLAVFRAPACVVDGRPAAFAGFLESDGDATSLRALLDRAAEWARAEGAETMYGPVDFDTFGSYRLRTDTPTEPPFPGEPYNRPEYAMLLEGAGWSPVRRYLSQVSVAPVEPDARQHDALAAIAKAGFTLEPLDDARWLALLPELHRMADAMFGEAFAYAPIPYDEFARRYGAGVARRLCPHTSLLARDAAGQLAAFLLCYPDYGPLAARGATIGRVPVSELSYAAHAPVLAAAGHRTAVAKTVGVLPAHRARGLMSALGVAAVARGAGRYDRWIAALMRADNHSRRWGERHARHERHYVLHGKSLTNEPLRGTSA